MYPAEELAKRYPLLDASALSGVGSVGGAAASASGARRPPIVRLSSPMPSFADYSNSSASGSASASVPFVSVLTGPSPAASPSRGSVVMSSASAGGTVIVTNVVTASPAPGNGSEAGKKRKCCGGS